MGEWLGLIGALAGTAIGGFVTYKVATQQHSHERRLEKHRRKIEAFEGIYDLLSTIASQASTLNIGVIGDLATSPRF
jgi:ABC-type lipoprotein release transport system permease subunit